MASASFTFIFTKQIISTNMSIANMKCKVCQVETPRRIRCGALVCEACKRFFMRHKRQHPNGEGIKCKHGDYKCLKEEENPSKLTQRGWLWRGLCAACRYKKCIKVGMQYRGKKNAIIAKESISSLTLSGNSTVSMNGELGDPKSSSTPTTTIVGDSVFTSNEKEIAEQFPATATTTTTTNNYGWLIEFCEQMKRKKEMEYQQQQLQLALSMWVRQCLKK